MSEKIIMVVDDEPSNIDLIRGILKDRFKIKAATSGDKAIKITQKTPAPDLILLDVMMPDMDGYEVCRQLKSEPDTRAIPVIFISGNTSSDEQQRGLDAGASAYLGKPIDPGLMLETIERILD